MYQLVNMNLHHEARGHSVSDGPVRRPSESPRGQCTTSSLPWQCPRRTGELMDVQDYSWSSHFSPNTHSLKTLTFFAAVTYIRIDCEIRRQETLFFLTLLTRRSSQTEGRAILIPHPTPLVFSLAPSVAMG